MRQKDSKSCGCFGSLFGKKPSGSGKGKNASGRSRIIRAASNHLLSSSRKKSGSPKKAQVSTNVVVQKSDGVADNGVTTTELQKKIISFRDLVNLPPCIGSLTIIELVKVTVEELHELYPDVVQCGSVSDSGTIHKAINELCESIKSLGKHWMHSDEWMVRSKKDDEANGDMEKYAVDLLDDIINVARERMFNKMDMDDGKEIKEDVESPSSSYGKSSRRSDSDKEISPSSPTTPTSVLPELPNNKSAKMDPLMAQVKVVSVGDGDDGGNSDGLVRAQMEISVPPSLLKSIVDAENVLIPAAGPSASPSSARPSISAAIISPPQQMVVSGESQSPPPGKGGESDISPPPPPPPPPDLAVGENDVTKPEPPPPLPPPPSMATRLSDPSPPPHSPAPPPPVAAPSPPHMPPGPPTPPPAPAAPGSNPPPPLPPSAPGNAMPGSLGSPSPPTTSGSIPPPPPPPCSEGSVPAPPPPPGASGTGSVPPPPPPSSEGSTAPPPAAAAASGSVPPPPPSSKGSAAAAPPPPPGQQRKGGAPPPPPALGGGGKVLRKSVSKLKRSSQMGCLYRQLKAKVEGSNTKATGKSPQKKGNKVGNSGGNGKQGMADALAEMTKRSSYFQQIEEDVRNYSGAVKEVKVALVSFQTTDMNELIKFHKYVESHLEKLTDETQVLARFEDFPGKKLEGLRMAGALYAKLDTIYTDLQNWKIEPPANDLLDRVENYFNKIKEDIDTLDRTKDDEIKRFKAQKIHFDFGILIRIKESMVDLSSSCMEMALKEKKEASSSKKNAKKTDSGKILWKAFQFAFRVYSFAGGQDERADNLTKEIAQQIQAETLQ